MDENDEALPDPPLWHVVKASALEWYILLIGVIASNSIHGMTFPIISVFMARLFGVGKNVLVFNLHGCVLYYILYYSMHIDFITVVVSKGVC